MIDKSPPTFGETARPVAPPSLMDSNDQQTLLPTG
jgi:hypothetical protein